MPVSDLDIIEEDVYAAIPIYQGVVHTQQAPPAPLVLYILSEGVSGIDFTLDDEVIDLSTLEDSTVDYIRMKLWIFRNGQKLIYDIGFTIDFDNNKIVPEYEADNEVFETYLYP